MNCYFTERNFQNEFVWRLWRTFARKIQKLKKTRKLYQLSAVPTRLAASLVEELLTSFNSFVTKMKEMASRGNDKGLGD